MQTECKSNAIKESKVKESKGNEIKEDIKQELGKIINYWNETFNSKFEYTENLENEYIKIRKKYNSDDINKSLLKYIEVAKPESYKQFRLVQFTFFKQSNWFIKFLNS